MEDAPAPVRHRAPHLKGKRIPVREGDVFEFKAPDGRLAYCLIVVGGGCPYAAFFRTLRAERPTMETLAQDEIALVGWTMDGSIYHGDWVKAGSLDVSGLAIPFPNFKVPQDQVQYVTDFKGRRLRAASEKEAELLDFQWSRSPDLFEDALFALNGLGPWKPYYEKSRFEYAAARSVETSA